MPASTPPPILPWDSHNQRLADAVHPSDWRNPDPAPSYNLVVIGGGTAGLVAAAGAAGLGAKVALVERHFLGGDCLNAGCVPSKALLRAARAVAGVRDAARFGVQVPGGVEIDFRQVMERMRRLRADLSPHDSARRFRELGVDVFFGQGRFVDRETVDVDGRRLRFAAAVIATGARAITPKLPGLSQVEFLTHDTLFSLTELPGRFGVIGAGPVGCEMAQAFARFGSDVVLVTSERGILPREDRDAAGIVRDALVRDGVRILRHGPEFDIESGPDGIRIRPGPGAGEAVVDRVLVAAGRAPNVEGLGLESVGVEHGPDGVRVDDRLRTTHPRIFACGDVCSKFRFTHAADFMARIVIRNALFLGRGRMSSLVVPWCTYTSPELARVGWNESEAREAGIDVDTFTQPLEKVDRAVLDGETEGFVRVHVRRGTDRIVGGTIVAAHAGEWIGELTLAMTSGLGLAALGNTIHPYPTQAEALRKTGDLFQRTRLTPRVRAWLSRWLAWRR